MSAKGKDKVSEAIDMRIEGDKEDSHSNIASDASFLKSSGNCLNFNEELIDYDQYFNHQLNLEGDLECLNELEINESPLRITYLL